MSRRALVLHAWQEVGVQKLKLLKRWPSLGIGAVCKPNTVVSVRTVQVLGQYKSRVPEESCWVRTGQELLGFETLFAFQDSLHYTILYYTLLYYTILYYTILYYTILYYTILYYTILYYTILYYTILYYTILYYTILYYTILD